MSDEEISKVVEQCDDPNAAASRLVDQALLHASRDNCTALVLPLGAWSKVYSSWIPISYGMELGLNIESTYII